MSVSLKAFIVAVPTSFSPMPRWVIPNGFAVYICIHKVRRIYGFLPDFRKKLQQQKLNLPYYVSSLLFFCLAPYYPERISSVSMLFQIQPFFANTQNLYGHMTIIYTVPPAAATSKAYNIKNSFLKSFVIFYL